MIREKDIYRAAKKIMDLYPGDGHAELAAAQHADVALEKGDLFNANLWKRILNAIHVLKMTKPKPEATVH